MVNIVHENEGIVCENDDKKDFFASIWGADVDGNMPGVHFIGSLNPEGGTMVHFPVTTVAGALAKADDISKAGHNAYFACAEYLTADNRKGENATGARALWLDIDCGEAKAAEGKGYPTKRAAIDALAAFCKAAGLPLPNIIVDSGNGLHCYWSFREFINRETWRKLASKLKKTLAKHVLLADPSRTADIASVLRVPGTTNYKDPANPKPVTLKRMTAPVDFKVFAVALDAASPEESPTSVNPFAAALAPAYPPLLETAENIAKVKAMLAAIPAGCDREKWRNACWATRATGWACAIAIAREWSMTAPDLYDTAEFDKVMDGFKPDGGIGFGTLVHIAREHGYREALPGGDSSPLDIALKEFNARYFVARVGGGVFVFDEQDSNILAGGMSPTAFQQFHAGRKINGDKLASVWVGWDQRRTYNRIVFDPTGKANEREFNTWRGLAVQPHAGGCDLIKAHVLQVWCGGNAAQADYVFRWMALLLIRPI